MKIDYCYVIYYKFYPKQKYKSSIFCWTELDLLSSILSLILDGHFNFRVVRKVCINRKK